jgi:hypothetical protein
VIEIAGFGARSRRSFASANARSRGFPGRQRRHTKAQIAQRNLPITLSCHLICSGAECGPVRIRAHATAKIDRNFEYKRRTAKPDPPRAGSGEWIKQQ